MADLAKRSDPFLSTSPLDAAQSSTTDDLFPADWDLADKSTALQELGVSDGRVTSGINRIIPCNCVPGDCITNKRGLCPLSKKPIKQTCPYEKAILETFIRGYLQELQPDPTEMGTISLIRDLADTELRIIRMNGDLANAEHLMQKDILAPNGALIATEYVENPLFGMQNKLMKLKHDILKLLANTRVDRQKKEENDNSDINRVAQAMARWARAVAEGRTVDGASSLLPEDDKFDNWFQRQNGNEIIQAEIIDVDPEGVVEETDEPAE